MVLAGAGGAAAGGGGGGRGRNNKHDGYYVTLGTWTRVSR